MRNNTRQISYWCKMTKGGFFTLERCINKTESEHYLLCYGYHPSYCEFTRCGHQVFDVKKTFQPTKAYYF